MRASRIALILVALGAVAAVLISGGNDADPRTPRGIAGRPDPFFGVAVIGNGGRAGAVDAYGDLVDLRAPGPTGRPLVEVPAARQAAGSVARDSVRVARVRAGGEWVPLWRADSITQRYLPGTNVLVTIARLGGRRFRLVRAIDGTAGAAADRRWIARARPLGRSAPLWASRLYLRSLLVLRALTNRRSGAVVAGARQGWAYVWPRDAAAVAIALASAGYRVDARRVVGFLRRLDLEAAARFDGSGEPVPGRAAQGDAAGWVRAAAIAAAPGPDERRPPGHGWGSGRPGAASELPAWRDRSDYQEKSPGDYLGNVVSTADGSDDQDMVEFRTHRGLVRIAGDPSSGLDSTAAWAVRPFPRPPLFAAARRTMLRLARESGRFGLLPSEDWSGGADPWTAPTAWTAWSLAVLGERRAALRLMAELRRDATPLGMLPERVDARTGAPRSTTPLAWSHAFAILALRALWPMRAAGGRRGGISSAGAGSAGDDGGRGEDRRGNEGGRR